MLELSGHFEIQKVMYGFCSVKDPQAVLPKYVLVNWVSLGSMLRRGCAVPTGIWLGVKELAVARGCGDPQSWCPTVVSGVGVTLLPLSARSLPGCHRWVRMCQTPANAPVPAT